jgi:hypothetical protein
LDERFLLRSFEEVVGELVENGVEGLEVAVDGGEGGRFKLPV